jgi:tetratricopeptide (TPR) repeat protein
MRRRVWVLIGGLATFLGCPDDTLDRARELEREGRIQEAGDLYVYLAKKDPANLGAWDGAVALWCKKHVNVGECMGVLDLELDLLGNLQRHHDALSEVLELRARARIEAGMAKAALADLDRARKAAPERASVFCARARALIMLGHGEEARDALDQAKKLEPKNAEADQLYRELPSSPGFGGD